MPKSTSGRRVGKALRKKPQQAAHLDRLRNVLIEPGGDGGLFVFRLTQP
jgi:hypothetical protein